MTIVVSELYLKWTVFKDSQIHPNETKLGAGEDKVNSIAFKEKQLFIMQAAEVISACVTCLLGKCWIERFAQTFT